MNFHTICDCILISLYLRLIQKQIFMGILYIIIGFIALVLIVAAIIKKEYTVSREIIINRPIGTVFGYIKYLKNQDDYSIWSKMDPNMEKTATGIDGTAGFIYAWDSPNKKVGKGEQEIIKVIENDSLQTELRFIKPFEGKAKSTMHALAVSDKQTKVIWKLESSMKYPMNIMLLFMNMERMIGNDFETGLSNLKQILETAHP